jgi:hypothetical protein
MRHRRSSALDAGDLEDLLAEAGELRGAMPSIRAVLASS